MKDEKNKDLYSHFSVRGKHRLPEHHDDTFMSSQDSEKSVQRWKTISPTIHKKIYDSICCLNYGNAIVKLMEWSQWLFLSIFDVT